MLVAKTRGVGIVVGRRYGVKDLGILARFKSQCLILLKNSRKYIFFFTPEHTLHVPVHHRASAALSDPFCHSVKRKGLQIKVPHAQ